MKIKRLITIFGLASFLSGCTISEIPSSSTSLLISEIGVTIIKPFFYAEAGFGHTLALTHGDEPGGPRDVYSWGLNDHGQLGLGHTNNVSVPMKVSFPDLAGDEFVDGIRVGYYHSLAITNHGRLFSWGLNEFGQLGLGDNADRHTPTLITPFTGEYGLAMIQSGAHHVLALSGDGKVYTWGRNDLGQLGDGTLTNKSSPVYLDFNLEEDNNIPFIISHVNYSFAISGGPSSSNIYAWGHNDFGQLGDGTTTNRSTPVIISIPDPLDREFVSGIAPGESHTLMVTSKSRFFAWGRNNFGQLGDGTTTDQLSPKLISGIYDLYQEPVYYFGPVMSRDGGASFMVTMDGDLYAWGKNDFGQLGDGTTINQAEPKHIQIDEGTVLSRLFYGPNHVVAVDIHDRIYSWGNNDFGQLGNGTTTHSYKPIRITNY